MLGERGGNRCNADVSRHLDGERGTQYSSRLGAGQVECQKPEGNRRQTSAHQGDHLGQKEVSISTIF